MKLQLYEVQPLSLISLRNSFQEESELENVASVADIPPGIFFYLLRFLLIFSLISQEIKQLKYDRGCGLDYERYHVRRQRRLKRRYRALYI